jgi:uncharacterized protein YdeI (YjbR/CyaY-like superfamily)
VKSLPKIHPKTRRGWRSWLEKHHAASDGVWVLFYRSSSGKKRLPYGDAVEEALCFGWIDGVLKPIDDESYMQLFTPRKRGSGWSRVNKQRIDRLIAAGAMHAAGLARIAAAKRDGSWSKLDAVENLELPPALERVFAQRNVLRERYSAWSPSKRKMTLYWINSVKSPDKRAERIATVVAMIEQNVYLTGPELTALHRRRTKRSEPER